MDATGPLCEHEFVNSAMLACLLDTPEARRLREMELSTYSQTDTKKKLHMQIIVLLGSLPGGTAQCGIITGMLQCTPMVGKKQVQNGSRISARLQSPFWLPTPPDEQHYF